MKPWGNTTVEERFWAKVKKTDSCWVWIGAKSPKRPDQIYGNFWNGSKVVGAHTYAYELENGPIIGELDHLCRTPLCVRPSHLEDVTHRVNCERSSKAQQTHCIHGHEFTPENTYIKGNGCRQCRACSITRAREATRRRQTSRNQYLRQSTSQPTT